MIWVRSCNRELGQQLRREAVRGGQLWVFDVRFFDDPHAGELRRHDGRRPALICTVVI